MPSSTVSEATSSPLTNFRPAPSIALRASDSLMPATFGTGAAVTVADGVGAGWPAVAFLMSMPMPTPAAISTRMRSTHVPQRREEP